jgi:regulator of sirC expression with transglutaminase-like and TPR domain
MMNEKEIQAMINLLEDPSEDVFSNVFSSLLEKGPEIIPELEKAWENSADQLYQERLENLIQKIQFNAFEKDIINWIRSDHSDILRGAYLVAKLQFPDLKYSYVYEPVEKIKNDVWIELNDNLTALEKIKILNHILFKVHGFSKNITNPFNPQNSYLNQVIETKKGNAVSLATIYLAVCQKLGLPVLGVDLPKNMILAFMDESGLNLESGHQVTNILFYINPYNRGSVLGKQEIEYYLKQSLIEPLKSHFSPCSNRVIIKRMVSSLITSYENLGYQDKIHELERILKLFPSGE